MKNNSDILDTIKELKKENLLDVKCDGRCANCALSAPINSKSTSLMMHNRMVPRLCDVIKSL